jgi:hypothetical protein
MIDRPNGPEMLAAIRQFLETELIPTQSDARLRFQTLVAANVLAIAEREWQHEDALRARECEWLSRWVGPVQKGELWQASVALCRRIRGGEFDTPDSFRTLARDIRRSVESKLEIANPRYLAAFRG